jgi:hypothetical protein
MTRAIHLTRESGNFGHFRIFVKHIAEKNGEICPIRVNGHSGSLYEVPIWGVWEVLDVGTV